MSKPDEIASWLRSPVVAQASRDAMHALQHPETLVTSEAGWFITWTYGTIAHYTTDGKRAVCDPRKFPMRLNQEGWPLDIREQADFDTYVHPCQHCWRLHAHDYDREAGK